MSQHNFYNKKFDNDVDFNNTVGKYRYDMSNRPQTGNPNIQLVSAERTSQSPYNAYKDPSKQGPKFQKMWTQIGERMLKDMDQRTAANPYKPASQLFPATKPGFFSKVKNWFSGLFSRRGKGYGGACWKNYKQVGMKMKNGRSVPNCVPRGGRYGGRKRHIGGSRYGGTMNLRSHKRRRFIK